MAKEKLNDNLLDDVNGGTTEDIGLSINTRKSNVVCKFCGTKMSGGSNKGHMVGGKYTCDNCGLHIVRHYKTLGLILQNNISQISKLINEGPVIAGSSL